MSREVCGICWCPYDEDTGECACVPVQPRGAMNKDEIIRMARQAGLFHFYDSDGHCDGVTDARLITEDKERDDDRLVEMLAPFAALVAAAERDKYEAKFKQLEALMQAREQQPNKPCCLAEREACAKVCEAEGQRIDASWQSCAAAIRAREQA